MEDYWIMFCGSDSSSSCIDHSLMVCFDVLLLVLYLFLLLCRQEHKKLPRIAGTISSLQKIVAIFNVVLGLSYLSMGIWIMARESVLPLHQWCSLCFHGLTWLLVSLTMSLRGDVFSELRLRFLSILTTLFSVIMCGFSILDKEVWSKIGISVLSVIGACLLLLSSYKLHSTHKDSTVNDLSTPLTVPAFKEVDLTPFETAGLLSKVSFWWLNPLMKKGKEKTLVDEDIPTLRQEDQAGTCYSMFSDSFDKQKEANPMSQPSVLNIILQCHGREIFVSGIFALMKILTLSAGPLLLNAFINVAEGNERFKNEGFLLAALLFFLKNLESLSQRQWYFRSRLIGLKVRSLLTAAIYKKQLRLSSSAKRLHSSGEIMNYITVDAYRVGEFPFRFHQTWTTSLQLGLALLIIYRAVGPATIASLVVLVLTVLANTPLARLQHEFQSRMMSAQDDRLKAVSESLVNMKVLKLYAWENHFKVVIQKLRQVEEKWLSAIQLRKAYNSFLFWSSPVLVSAATFGACYFLGVPLNAGNVFTFVATLRLVQDPVKLIPDVIAVVIQARVAFDRIVEFLEVPELETADVRKKGCVGNTTSCHNIVLRSACLSWEKNRLKPTLRNVTLEVKHGEKVAVCGEVGSGKSTLLTAILGEVPVTDGMVEVRGSIAYVSQSAWIQSGSIRENILFGSPMNCLRYQETVEKCCLVKDLELLPHGDLTEIGERGVNLSGGQKQRIQLARALYQNADIYLLDDPFSAVDAQTASNLFQEYVTEALSEKTVLLVTHQVDFLPAFESILFLSDGEIVCSGSYHELLASSKGFQSLVDAHNETAGSDRPSEVNVSIPTKEIRKRLSEKSSKPSGVDQLIKQEEREVGDTGFKPHFQYLGQNKGYLFFTLAAIFHASFVLGRILQNSWMAAYVGKSNVSTLKLIIVYLIIGLSSTVLLLCRSLCTVTLGLVSSRSIFLQLLNSLFRAPMLFYDSTPLGRILSRVSADLSIVDLDLAFTFVFTVSATTTFISNILVLTVLTWQVLAVSIPLIYLALLLQRYYLASAKELMRINGTTKSFVANHVAESLAGAMTIRAFEQEHRFFVRNLELVDANASPFFHNFAANEWLIQRLETVSAVVLASSALCMVLVPSGTFSSGFIGMALSYGLSLNGSLVNSIQYQCAFSNNIISVERLNQYMNIPSEAPEVIEQNRPPANWPADGKVEIHDLQIRYRPDSPMVLRGISCTFEGGNKIGVVGRTGSGKTTLIGALFRLVEPVGGRILVDGIDICSIGLHDLRSRFGIIPQDPTLFTGTVRHNLDPLGQHNEKEIWEVLGKCQLKDAVKEKEDGLDSLVVEDGLNWSMGQRQLFCLGRALLRRSKVLVLDEATASIDNATDMILQKTIRSEFADCTVITVAHRIPTVMDCTKVLAISDGKLVEFDEPLQLMKKEGSLFGRLVKEYWSHYQSAELA